MGKKMIFISGGRCGTTRIAEILNEHLPEDFVVTHQMRFSRCANVIGNIMSCCGESEYIKDKLYHLIISKYLGERKHFITTDPLTSMVIPRKVYESDETCIVHIIREPILFAKSFFALSRRNLNSFIAHNFIPFWQIGIWPLQNLISGEIYKSYGRLAEQKKQYFEEKYHVNPNYVEVSMDRIFKTTFLSEIIGDFFSLNLVIDPRSLEIKTN